MIQNVINADIPVRGLGWLTGYLAMLFGALITILVQSSSVFTSTLTPLAGAGLVNLERAYPLTLGSNIGTTTTSLLAALASKGNEKEAIQIALVHLCFNITGIVLFYPLPFMRWPILLAQKLGDITSRYRWFSIAYLSLMFFIFPAIVFGFSLAGPTVMYVVLIPTVATILLVILINILQNNKPELLPTVLANWTFLPESLRSLDPLDRLVTKALRCCNRNKDTEEHHHDDNRKQHK